MAWTAFSGLTSAGTPALDANLNQLGLQSLNPCTISGTNSLAVTLLSAANQPPVTSYQNYLAVIGVAAGSNTGAVTAALGGLTALNVYKDTSSGPVALVGGEIVANNMIVLVYDAALNGGIGGWHLINGVVLTTTGSAPVTVTNNSGVTLTAAQLTGSGTRQAVITRAGSPGAGFNDTTDTATAIVAAIPGCGVDTYFELRVFNNTGQTQTLVAGSGVTVTGPATTAASASHIFTGVVTAIGTPAVTIFG